MLLRREPKDRRLVTFLAVGTALVVGIGAGTLLLYRSGVGRGPNSSALVSPLKDTPVRRRLREVHRQAMELLRAGRYSAAAEKFAAAFQEASQAGDELAAARHLNSLGVCYVATFRYREGMSAYLRAKQMALRQGDWEGAAGLEASLSVLYLEMGDVNSALEAAESGLALLRNRPAPDYRPRLLIQLGKLRARKGQLDVAMQLFSEAIQEADRNGDWATQGLAWNYVGYELLRAGQLEAAETALLEAFRLRKFSKDKALLTSYRLLGLLRMAQGDLASASRLLDQAVAMGATSPRLIPAWQLHHDRGRVRMAQGRLEPALEDFRQAVESARRWRPEALPADAVRVSLEAGLQEVYSSFIEAGNRLYFFRGDRALARETFEVAEENRAYSLRMLVAEPQEWRDRLPPEYGETLARLRDAEATLLAGNPTPSRSRIGELDRRLTEMEARTGMDLARVSDGAGRSSGLATKVEASLGPKEALLSFHLGEPESYMWGITREGLELTRLPPRSQLQARVRSFVEAIQRGSGESVSLAGTLYNELLSGVGESTRRKPHWLLTLDDVLFELPFAALAEGSGPGGVRFLVERHSLEVVPSAHLLVSARSRRRPEPRAGGAFLGVGDPVYSTADPRWKARSGTARGAGKRLELPRLAGSARELRACAQLWSAAGSSPVLLEGPAATGEQVLKHLESRPRVTHFATHVVPSSRKRGLIALSLSPSGDSELLTPLEIVHWRRSPSLVVLSGCSSAQGEALPGAGLMGLTRAWLAAGADMVIASRWATSDDTGEMFLSFYRRLLGDGGGRAGLRPAAALQGAQQEMLRSGSWRSAPKYWAAFFAVGAE